MSRWGDRCFGMGGGLGDWHEMDEAMKRAEVERKDYDKTIMEMTVTKPRRKVREEDVNPRIKKKRVDEDGSTNPKAALGALKAPMGFTPPTALIEVETVMAGGAHKYGAYNFRDTAIDAMTYIGAIDRHFRLWQDGVDIDAESGQSHLAHIMACCALIIDSMHTGMLVDNRYKSGLVEGLFLKSASAHNKFIAAHKGVDDGTE